MKQTNRDHQVDFEFANILVNKVGFYTLMNMKKKFTTAWKSDNSPVTNLDLGINDLVIEEISKEYPNDEIIGEELSSKGNSGYKWIVDPIDGTQALELLPTITTCLALVDPQGQPIFGLCFNPKKMRLYSCFKGDKSRVDGKELRVSKKNTMKSSYIFMTSSQRIKVHKTNGQIYDELESKGAKILNIRSLAYSCCLVARGRADATIIPLNTPFEIATMKLIVENAGGKVTDYFGNPIDRVDGEIKGAVLTNGLLHDQVLNILNG